MDENVITGIYCNGKAWFLKGCMALSRYNHHNAAVQVFQLPMPQTVLQADGSPAT